MTYRVLQ